MRKTEGTVDADVIVVGAGLAGLVAATEAADAGAQVLLLDQEGAQSLGGQAYWSLGGLFLVDSPEQRRMGIHDSLALATQDWWGSADFGGDNDVGCDGAGDRWPQAWARAYLDFAAGENRAWLHAMGHRLFPVVGWAERGDGRADGHGNSVPRFHLTWGTGPGLLEPFVRRTHAHLATGQIRARFRHAVDDLILDRGAVTGVHGRILEPTDQARGRPTSRVAVGEFTAHAQAVVVASGGIGGNLDLVRRSWPQRLGTPPADLVAGVPAYVDGRMLGIATAAGARVINGDRMWHYPEGLRNWDPIWERHGIRILPGPSAVWLDATGRRLPPPYLPGFDSLGSLVELRRSGYDHSWFVMTRRVLATEIALSGSEQNADLTGRSVRLLGQRLGGRVPDAIDAFVQYGEDIVVADDLEELVAGMNRIAGAPTLDAAQVRAVLTARDRQLDHPFGKDTQVTYLREHRRHRGDRWLRTAPPHRFLDPRHGPLVAIRLHVLTRKTLGGLETDLSGRCLTSSGAPLPGLYAAGEVCGFGGGGMMGHRALEGTFLGGCLFSGRAAGRAVADAVR